MADLTSLLPLTQAEFQLGLPTPRAIYDRHGKLLLAAGIILSSAEQLQSLIAQGYARTDHRYTPAPRVLSALPAQGTSQGASQTDSTLLSMEQIRWFVGETLHLQDSRSELNRRYAVKLVGYIKQKSVLVSAPLQDGRPVLLQEKQSFVVRAFQGRKAYAFSSSVLHTVEHPQAYVHLSYPSQVSSSLIRHAARASVDLPAWLQLHHPERRLELRLIDLSLGGAAGVIRQTLPERASGTLHLQLMLLGECHQLALSVLLRSFKPGGSNQQDIGGLEFTALSAQQKLILSAYVHHAIANTL